MDFVHFEQITRLCVFTCVNCRMKTLAVDNPVDTPSHHRQSQSAANLSTPIRYKVCLNGFAYITTPTTSIFQQVVPASMMWFVSISLSQVVQISYYIIVQFCKPTS